MRRSAIARCIVAASVLLAMTGVIGGALVDASLPLLHRGFAALAPEFGLRALARGTDGRQASLVAEVFLARPVVVAGRRYEPDPRGSAWVATPAGHVLLLPAVVGLLVVVAPAAGRREAGVRALVATAAVLPAMAVDVPAVLAANVWGLFPGGSPREGTLGAWAAFMTGGGRIAVGVLVGTAAIAAGRRAAITGRAEAAARTAARSRPAARPPPSERRSASRRSRAAAHGPR